MAGSAIAAPCGRASSSTVTPGSSSASTDNIQATRVVSGLMKPSAPKFVPVPGLLHDRTSRATGSMIDRQTSLRTTRSQRRRLVESASLTLSRSTTVPAGARRAVASCRGALPAGARQGPCLLVSWTLGRALRRVRDLRPPAGCTWRRHAVEPENRVERCRELLLFEPRQLLGDWRHSSTSARRVLHSKAGHRIAVRVGPPRLDQPGRHQRLRAEPLSAGHERLRAGHTDLLGHSGYQTQQGAPLFPCFPKHCVFGRVLLQDRLIGIGELRSGQS